jgi:hypothetical protein
MKATILMMLLIFLGKGCNDETAQDIKTAVIEYTANTRGYYRKITVQDEKVYVSAERGEKGLGKQVTISDADRKALIDAFQEVNLDDLPGLKAPSEKRFYDGAAIANLKITYKEKTYETQAFDHGNPPAEIEKLVTKMVSFVKEE